MLMTRFAFHAGRGDSHGDNDGHRHGPEPSVSKVRSPEMHGRGGC
jgi:hypothetical protein